MARQLRRARGLARQRSNTRAGGQSGFLNRIAPSLAGVGLANFSRAQTEPRRRALREQGAAFQRDLRAQEANIALAARGQQLEQDRFERGLASRIQEADKDRGLRRDLQAEDIAARIAAAEGERAHRTKERIGQEGFLLRRDEERDKAAADVATTAFGRQQSLAEASRKAQAARDEAERKARREDRIGAETSRAKLQEDAQKAARDLQKDRLRVQAGLAGQQSVATGRASLAGAQQKEQQADQKRLDDLEDKLSKAIGDELDDEAIESIQGQIERQKRKMLRGFLNRTGRRSF